MYDDPSQPASRVVHFLRAVRPYSSYKTPISHKNKPKIRSAGFKIRSTSFKIHSASFKTASFKIRSASFKIGRAHV